MNLNFYIFFILFNTVTGIAGYFLKNEELFSKVGKSVYVFLLSNLFYLIFYFLLKTIKSNSIRKYLENIILILMGIIFIFEAIVLIEYKNTIDLSIVAVILESNLNEVKEFVNQALISITNIKFIYLSIFLYFLIFLYKKLKNINLNKTYFKVVQIISLFVALLSSYRVLNGVPLKYLPFTRLYYGVKEATKELNKYRDLSNSLNKEATILTNNSNIENVILVLGESTSRNHMQLYNYYLENNPKLKERENLIVFNDIISSETNTRNSLRKIFTFQNYETENIEWYKRENLIEIMKKAGYKTYWLSNQESFGIYGNVGAAIASKSDTVIYNSFKHSEVEDKRINFDEDLVSYLNLILKDGTGEKKFIVLHLMGSHSFYKNRYPENFEVYKTDDIILKSSSANKEILKYYNNSILYGDYVLDKIFESLNEYEGIAFYLSDHGEELYENGFAGHYGKGGNKWMLEIPLFIYPTDKFKIKYPEKVEELKSSKNRPYMTDDFIHTFLDVLDIKTQDFDETRSIINSNFNTNRKRIYGGKDYDLELQ